eukprot:gnl/MRDRNA2_/MRDRNA2_18511_c0_seq1.p1 gnl/MRDRNA2_/MRDRNA2_18511_c0~~gnl/MRDRNA2_/MRDRNA2_18511_c0_seq1.p1  ORF type:complete len:587 (+),score=85.52 gnl/MRDRNA2_/MRDRNA2_18511_c0_seq1:240-1763(+)
MEPSTPQPEPAKEFQNNVLSAHSQAQPRPPLPVHSPAQMETRNFKAQPQSSATMPAGSMLPSQSPMQMNSAHGSNNPPAASALHQQRQEYLQLIKHPQQPVRPAPALDAVSVEAPSPELSQSSHYSGGRPTSAASSGRPRTANAKKVIEETPSNRPTSAQATFQYTSGPPSARFPTPVLEDVPEQGRSPIDEDAVHASSFQFASFVAPASAPAAQPSWSPPDILDMARVTSTSAEQERSWADGQASILGGFKLWSYETIQEEKSFEVRSQADPGDAPGSATAAGHSSSKDDRYTDIRFLAHSQQSSHMYEHDSLYEVSESRPNSETYERPNSQMVSESHDSRPSSQQSRYGPGIEVLDMNRMRRTDSDIAILDLSRQSPTLELTRHSPEPQANASHQAPRGEWAPVTPWGASEPFSMQRLDRQSADAKSESKFVPLEPLSNGGPRAPEGPWSGRRSRPRSGNRNRGLYQVTNTPTFERRDSRDDARQYPVMHLSQSRPEASRPRQGW